MNTSDVQVYSYVTDEGRRISATFGVSGDIGKFRRVDVSITVDDVERLHASGHWTLPPNIPLGEWFLHGVLNCLCTHMEEYCRFELLNNLLRMAQADELQLLPIDDRHISELTDEQAEWWNEDDNHPLVDYLLAKVRPLVNKVLEEYPQLRAELEN